MSDDVAGYAKAMNEAAKTKLRNQMHHDLCVLTAGGANLSGSNFPNTASQAMALYKELWLQVMKEIP